MYKVYSKCLDKEGKSMFSLLFAPYFSTLVFPAQVPKRLWNQHIIQSVLPWLPLKLATSTITPPSLSRPPGSIPFPLSVTKHIAHKYEQIKNVLVKTCHVDKLPCVHCTKPLCWCIMITLQNHKLVVVITLPPHKSHFWQIQNYSVRTQ